MAKYSKKVMGKEVGSAEVYAEPHTMSGAKLTSAKDSVTKTGSWTDKLNMSVGAGSKGNYTPENKNGEITMRGYGAATKGIKSRGPMA
jgi:hypothetical protein